MIYIFLANGFEEIEAICPIDILKRGGLDVKTVGVTGKTVTGAHGIPFVCDMEIGEISADAECLILPGGMPGTLNLANCPKLKELLLKAQKDGRFIAAICAAPSVLGAYGILKGKKAVCYPGFEEKLDGATVRDELCVTDGKIITAKGPGAAAEFGFSILSALKGETETAEKLKVNMIF